MNLTRTVTIGLTLLGLLSWTGCADEKTAGAASNTESGEDDLTAAKTVYFADLGPEGIEFYTRRGGRVVELSSPGTLTGDEDEPGSGTVRIGGDGCKDCLFFKKPNSGEWINVARPSGKTLKRSKWQYEFSADGYLLTSPIVKVTVSENDPEYGDLEVTWP